MRNAWAQTAPRDGTPAVGQRCEAGQVAPGPARASVPAPSSRYAATPALPQPLPDATPPPPVWSDHPGRKRTADFVHPPPPPPRRGLVGVECNRWPSVAKQLWHQASVSRRRSRSRQAWQRGPGSRRGRRRNMRFTARMLTPGGGGQPHGTHRFLRGPPSGPAMPGDSRRRSPAGTRAARRRPWARVRVSSDTARLRQHRSGTEQLGFDPGRRRRRRPDEHVRSAGTAVRALAQEPTGCRLGDGQVAPTPSAWHPRTTARDRIAPRP